MAERLRAGFVGVGDMGGPMARHIIQAGFPTTLWARRPASLEKYGGLSFRTASDLVDLGLSSDVCGVCVFSDEDTRQVCLGEAGVLAGMQPGSVLLLHPTIQPETVIEIAEAGEARGVAVLDAPVAGTVVRAEEGDLSVIVGGDAAGFEKAMPVMQAYGRTIQLMGQVGSGVRMKTLNNLLTRINLGMAYQALEMGVKLGMDRAAVLTILRSASADSFMMNFLADRILPNPGYAKHLVTMGEKDNALFVRLRQAAGLPPSALEDAAQQGIVAFHEIGALAAEKAD